MTTNAKWEHPHGKESPLQHGYVGNAYIGAVWGPYPNNRAYPKPYRVESPFIHRGRFFTTGKAARSAVVKAFLNWQAHLVEPRDDVFMGGIR